MRTEYVWISTKASHNGKTAIVMAHHKTREQAEAFIEDVYNGGYEGPVKKINYPIGLEFQIAED